MLWARPACAPGGRPHHLLQVTDGNPKRFSDVPRDMWVAGGHGVSQAVWGWPEVFLTSVSTAHLHTREVSPVSPDLSCSC